MLHYLMFICSFSGVEGINIFKRKTFNYAQR